MTQEIKKLIKERDKIFRKHKSNPTNDNYRKEYTKSRNKIAKKIKIAKNLHYRSEFKQCQGDIKGTWDLVKKVMGKKRTNIDTVIETYLGKDKTAEEITEEFAGQYIKNIEKAMHTCDKKTYEDTRKPVDFSFHLPKAKTKNIEDIINKLNIHKAPGNDGIRGIELKTLNEKISPYITHLINQSLETGQVPSKLKTAIHLPIYKSGSHKDYNNYRQIANLSVVNKVMEKYVAEKLKAYLKAHNIIIKNQHGFQEKKGTETLLSEFTDLIQNRLDKQEHVLITYVDYTKAFDLLNKNIMIKELKKIGIHGKALKWLINYMSDRQYTVRYQETYSTMHKTDTAIVQGSILGPILYIIYTNGLTHQMQKTHTEIFMFADDIAIVTYHPNLDMAEKIMQKNFNTLQKFSHDYMLVINGKKTKLTHVRSPQQISREIKIIKHTEECLHDFNEDRCTCTETIGNERKFKYLGLTIDHRFKFDDHIQVVAKKLRTCLYLFYHLQFFITNIDTKVVIYKSLAESHIRYGILSYGNTTKTHLKTISDLQLRILKIIDYRNRSNSDLFSKLNILLTGRSTD